MVMLISTTMSALLSQFGGAGCSLVGAAKPSYVSIAFFIG